MTKNEKKLQSFLEELTNLSQKFSLCLQWTKEGIEIQEFNQSDNDGDIKDLHYSCVQADGRYSYPTIAEDLLFDD